MWAKCNTSFEESLSEVLFSPHLSVGLVLITTVVVVTVGVVVSLSEH